MDKSVGGTGFVPLSHTKKACSKVVVGYSKAFLLERVRSRSAFACSTEG